MEVVSVGTTPEGYPVYLDKHAASADHIGVVAPYGKDDLLLGTWGSKDYYIVDKQGKVRFIERYGKGELPDPDKILAEIKKLSP